MLALNTAIGLALIFLWLQFVDVGQIFLTLSQTNLSYLILVFIFLFFSIFIRSLRFKIFLSKIKRIKFSDLLFLNGVAMLFNFYIPIRAGEIAKGIYLNTQYGLPLSKSLVWVFLDRFLDFLVVLLLSGVLLLIIPTSLSINFITIIIIILSLALLVTYLAIFNKDFAQKLVKFLINLLIFKNIKIYFERFSSFILDSFTILNRKPIDLFSLLFLTILAYATDAAIWYFTFLAISYPQPFINMYLGQLLSALTYLIPAAPGYVGSAEASGLLIFSGVFGLEPNLASAMVVLFHILTAVFILIFGIISVYFLKIDLRMILKKALHRS
mgnify:CR=1 FL=1